jgi:acyl carrier protein
MPARLRIETPAEPHRTAIRTSRCALPLLSSQIDLITADGRPIEVGGAEVYVRAELTDFIVTNYLFGDVTRTPGDDESLVEGGVIDSTGVLELIEFLESHFAIEVSDTETVPQNLGTIANLTRFVGAKKAVREPSR